jgi:dipeptidyl aminopeptidase/acylaminoacyl peptidase
MKKLYSIALFIALAATSVAQKADFQAAEKFSAANLATRTGDLAVQPVWIEENDIFWYSYKMPSGKNWWYVEAAKKNKQPLFDSRYMATQLHLLTKKPYNELDLPIKELKFEKKSITRFTFQIDSVKFSYDMVSRTLAIKDTIHKKDFKEPRWAAFSPDSVWFAYALNHNLYIMKRHDKDSVGIQLTTDGEQYFSYARNSSDTARNKKQYPVVRWFKNSEKLFAERSDVRKVRDLFVIDVLASPRPKLETYRYSMPGEEFVPQDHISVFDVATRGRVDINLDKWKDQTIEVRWSSQKSADKLIVVRKDRPLKKLDVCLVNAVTGEVKVLFSEEIWPYFNNDYAQLSVLNEGNDLIWWSERTGWGQLYHYDGNGKMLNQISDGYFVTGNVQQIDTLNRMIYFEAFGREKEIHPYYSLTYKASIDRGGMNLVTKEDASHSMSMSKSSKYYVDNFSRVDLEPRSVLRDNNGNILMELERPDLSELYRTGWKKPETFRVKAKDGVTDLFGVMYKPFDFDSTRKYPVISYVYPGPQTESVPYTFSVSGRYNVALAQLGFIVVNFGHRGGSPQRSHYYHSFGYDDLRDYALADDKYGIEQLADICPYIDINRVGIYGHSGGGFMSTAALLSYPDFYDVAVSSAGNHDNNIYNQWWGETHDGVEEVEKKVKLKEGETGDTVKISFKAEIKKNQDLAGKLKGHLLLVHGDIDNNVHPGNTIRVADALIKANKRFDMMIMPGQRHSFGNYAVYFERLMWYYFAEHLLDDYRTNVDLYDYMGK